MPNRLSREKSPYLLQHAHNPVDWYPWGPEALERARRENRPIFLSVGYSSCYWCHVMERQCFENESIARLMNERFVNIKVDREERPDIDQLYMLAVQILTRQGGWPMSVFLTPDLKPFFGGTYFPPQDVPGRPGFGHVVTSVHDAYENRRDQVERSADEIVRLMTAVSAPRVPESPIRIDRSWIQSLLARSTSDFDACCGGFSGAPKFPRQTLLELLITAREIWPEEGSSPGAPSPADMLRRTLDAMADGGIRDQLGGGFHRYSTDDKWLVPHFEIMLYDNAMLATCYARAYRLLDEPRYARVARGILDFVLREMASPQGAFHTAFDAEVDAMEGATYLWTAGEVRDVLQSAFPNQEIELFLRAYGLDQGPNFADPHHGSRQPETNVLHLPAPLAELAATLKSTESELDARLHPMRNALLAARKQRKQPMLDTKILVSWNALMIRAMTLAGKLLDEPKYINAAVRAAENFVSDDRTLPRHGGVLDDYAFLAHALLALHEATGQGIWRTRAAKVVASMKDRFLDTERGGFFFTSKDSTELPVCQKTAQDSPLPSGNAVAAMCMLKLDDVDEARRVLAVFAQATDDMAEAMSSMIQAGIEYLKDHEPFVVSSADVPREHVQRVEDQAQSAVRLTARWESPTELIIDVEIVPPFHLNVFDAGDGMVLPNLTLLVPAGVTAVVDHPPAQKRTFAFSDQPIDSYQDHMTIRATLSQALSTGTPLRASLSYQACTEDACLPPATKAIDLTAP